jgi:hypothetical protein
LDFPLIVKKRGMCCGLGCDSGQFGRFYGSVREGLLVRGARIGPFEVAHHRASSLRQCEAAGVSVLLADCTVDFRVNGFFHAIG